MYGFVQNDPVNNIDPKGLNAALVQAIYDVWDEGYNDAYQHCYMSCKGSKMDGAEYNTENSRAQMELTNILLLGIEAGQTFMDGGARDWSSAWEENGGRDMPFNRAGNECAEDCEQTCEECCEKYAGGKYPKKP